MKKVQQSHRAEVDHRLATAAMELYKIHFLLHLEAELW